jgi:hypothetical protein
MDSTAHLSHRTQLRPSRRSDSSTVRMTGSLATFLSVKMAILALARSEAGSSAITPHVSTVPVPMMTFP